MTPKYANMAIFGHPDRHFCDLVLGTSAGVPPGRHLAHFWHPSGSISPTLGTILSKIVKYHIQGSFFWKTHLGDPGPSRRHFWDFASGPGSPPEGPI